VGVAVITAEPHPQFNIEITPCVLQDSRVATRDVVPAFIAVPMRTSCTVWRVQVSGERSKQSQPVSQAQCVELDERKRRLALYALEMSRSGKCGILRSESYIAVRWLHRAQ
jgi:hypothetical protein